jgi:pimeloyl-ACP methyl ester carboxylesterase
VKFCSRPQSAICGVSLSSRTLRLVSTATKVSLPKESPALDAPQSLIARNYNLVRYTRLPRGGHFAFWEQPAAMVADVRAFFRTLRS